ncbi:MAG: YncE family protein [Desulforhopalus sp.]
MKYRNLYAGCILTLIVSSGGHALAAVPETGQDNRVEWQVLQKWPTTAKTLDMVHSLDGKFVYVLNDKQQVQVFDAQGQLQGSIPVAEGVSAIDIAPRGEQLYLINNKDNSFSSISVSFITNVDITGSPFKGLENAPVTLVVFSDFE